MIVCLLFVFTHALVAPNKPHYQTSIHFDKTTSAAVPDSTPPSDGVRQPPACIHDEVQRSTPHVEQLVELKTARKRQSAFSGPLRLLLDTRYITVGANGSPGTEDLDPSDSQPRTCYPRGAKSVKTRGNVSFCASLGSRRALHDDERAHLTTVFVICCRVSQLCHYSRNLIVDQTTF